MLLAQPRSWKIAARVVLVSCVLAGFAIEGAWIFSHQVTLHRQWSSGPVLYEALSHCGRLTLVEMRDWWRVETPQWILNPPLCEPPDQWLGMDIHHHRRGPGLEWADGEHTTRYVEVTPETKFIRPADRERIANGTMLRSTVRFRLWSVHWGWIMAGVLLPIAPSWLLLRRLRQPGHRGASAMPATPA